MPVSIEFPPPAPVDPEWQHIRLAGVTAKDITHDGSRYRGVKSVVYNILDQRFDLIGVKSCQLSKRAKNFSRVINLRRKRSHWRFASDMNPWTFKYRSGVAEDYLRQHAGQFDVVVQMDTLLAPGSLKEQRPYVIVTDNTYALTHRYWPEWAPMVPRHHRKWLALEGDVYRNASALFVWSEFTRRSMIDDYGVDPARVFAVGCGANLYDETLQKTQYDSHKALYIGNDFERKGGYVMLEAWGRVREAIPDAELLIVGPQRQEAPDQDGVRWLGRIDHAELRKLYYLANQFVMPSLFEPWGMVLMEAMGLGLPCVVTNHNAAPEFITSGENGTLVPPGEAGPLADAMLTLLSDPDKAAALGKVAHGIILEHFTWDKVMGRIMPHLAAIARS
jgi:glycosyltransferase involved in cell wall biosynthesis